MSKRLPDTATIQSYLESLPEYEVEAIFEKVSLKAKQRWEFWLGVFLFVVWCVAWIWVASGRGLIAGIVGGAIALFFAGWCLWPFVGWLNNRVLREEVASRIVANGV